MPLIIKETKFPHKSHFVIICSKQSVSQKICAATQSDFEAYKEFLTNFQKGNLSLCHINTIWLMTISVTST